MSTHHTQIDSALGRLTLVADEHVLTGVYFPQHWHLPTAGSIGDLVPPDSSAVLLLAADELTQHLAGARSAFTVPHATQGSPFQEQVWAMLKQIPYGTTTTYGALARELGDVSLAQQVGRAVGRNPLSVVVPCHRVVGAGGRLTGYAGGLSRKAFLLDLEAPTEVAAGRLF